MKKFTIILSTIIIVLVLSGKAYFHYSVPSYTGEKTIPALTESVEVFTDEFGVPHIIAQNEKDLFYMAGYITARERLFQMTTAAAAGRGELSLLFGDGMINSDIYLRNWGIPMIGKKLAENADAEMTLILDTFCEGINAWIDETGSSLPPEFKILGIKPIKWNRSDVLGYARLMARELQQSWKPEMLYGSVLDYFGPEKTAEILPPDDPNRIVIANYNGNFNYSGLLNEALILEESIRSLTGTNVSNVGSNNWVLSGKKTTTGKPILCNDPHLGFTQPAKWFEMHLKGGRFDVSGVFLPGVPIPIIGQNQSCSWGYTNVMADDMDFFVETVKDGKYFHDGKWKDLVLREETIPLKGGRDTTITIASTVHGPIVLANVHPLIDAENKAISVAWTGHWESNELGALKGLSLMKNWNDFSAAVEQFTVPGQNMIFADTAGNIGWRPAVKLPIRKDGNSLIPRPGDDPEYDWKGKIPFKEMPFLYNPPSGYIATANNKTIDSNYPHYISNLWCDHARVERIHEILKQEKLFSIEDIKMLQTDVLSAYAREMTPYFLASLNKVRFEGVEAKALEILKDWDYQHHIDSPGALIFNVTMNQFIHQTYEDELALLSDKHFEAFVDIVDLPYRTIMNAVKQERYSWFDDVKTQKYSETAGDIIERSFRSALEIISDRSGKHPKNWRWGEYHTITHPHDMGKIAILDYLFEFNVGPFESPGSPNTVNDGGYNIDEPFRHKGGPSMRRIVDMGNINETLMILPSGNSGLPKSKHYRDQAPLYNKGMYKTTFTDESTIRNIDKMRKQVFSPAG